ncbi:PAS/PAC sensor-containing signal transduction diguanylate cyclase/phosphodiesterase [Oleiphilus messinensis]|uniref:cyclic-guanylate-specific phosphodiesterase n=1 Tax=Oleiphilus messinensis TaxID=141451 RepID=A0A1Y0IAD0_9GAMM|nr:EAL domain-containing protein [Oleiphilus messinensis]ARU56353.1 PAS/PAC sensor-containing signal transduction diguanylate cyclase/phosphodiesterase [Oleiphilus messinensis]
MLTNPGSKNALLYVPLATICGFVISIALLARNDQINTTDISALVVGFSVALGLISLILARANAKLHKSLSEQEVAKHTLTKLSSAITNSGASIIITDSRGIIEYVNDKFVAMTGWTADEIRGNTISVLNPIESTETEDSLRLEPSCLGENWKGEVLCRGKGDQRFWAAVTISAVSNDCQQVTNYVLSGIDISDLKEVNRKMEQLALFDSLTGLANRRLFIDRLNQSIKSAKRHGNKIALLFLDLDQFKRINDTLGHDSGDMLLLTVADRLKSCVRSQDTVARLGGDEFTILLNDVDDAQDATTVAKHILKTLKEPIKLGQHEVIVSTSIGITLAPDDSSNSDTLMKNADLALYKAKEKGRDGYYFFTEELNIRAIKLLTLEQELRHALQFDEFTLLFQPQVHIKSGEINSVEALIRWHHPTRGRVSPDDFIAVAEETGLIVPIGEWVLKKACIEIKMLQQLTQFPLKVAVNLSARQFKDPKLETVIKEVLECSGLEPQFLELEVTESMLMDDIQSVIAQLNRIKATGVTITIDDFGSGYSSLSYLKRLPVDILKVDREFVRDIPDDLNDMEITSAVIAVAHKLNLKVIAEGVENIDQRDFLVINKCDYAQGYYFSKPLTFEDLYDYFCKIERISA